MSTPDFPEGFQGAGPMFAAAELGDPWYRLAALGTDTYIRKNCEFGSDADLPESAFLDRADAETVADASSGGIYEHWHGLSARVARTPAAQRELGWEAAGQPSQADREAAARESDAEAWGGRGPLNYVDWLAEGQAEADHHVGAEYEADWENEWDDADSNAYQARVEAGLETEAG
jgi:hypothetical protein